MSSYVFTCEPEWEAALEGELRRTLSECGASFAVTAAGPGRVLVNGIAPDSANFEPVVAFANQCLPEAEACSASSISAWAEQACERISATLDETDVPCRLHVFTLPFPDGSTGYRRGQLVLKQIAERLRERRRRLFRRMNPDAESAWQWDEALVQVLLTAPAEGFLSVAPASRRRTWRRCVSRFVGGVVEPAVDKQAPSRAFAKLVEAETRLGRPIAAGETCVDLGSAPGSWAYTALRRGARVTAIDRSPLRDDLMRDPRLTFVRGDAFDYEPEEPVDWLLSDIIAFPDRIRELLERWLGTRRCRRFCVTVKFRGRDDDAELEGVKSVLRRSGYEFCLRRLTANKNEATAYGFWPEEEGEVGCEFLC